MAAQQNILGTTYIPAANTRCVVHGVSVGTGAVMALAAGIRTALFFHNPGTVPICFFQGNSPAGLAQILSFGAAGTILLNPNTTWEINPCGPGSWWAIASAIGGALTVMEF